MYTICKLFYINARTHARAPTLIDIHNHTQYKCSEYWKLIIQSDLKKKSQPNTTYYLKTRILLKSHLDELKHKDITKVTLKLVKNTTTFITKVTTYKLKHKNITKVTKWQLKAQELY